MMSLRRPWSNCQVAIAMAKDSERIWEKTRNRGTQTELGGRQAGKVGAKQKLHGT